MATSTKVKIPPQLQADWCLIDEAMDLLCRRRTAVTLLVQDGVIEVKKYGRVLLFSRASIKRYLDSFKPVGV